MNPSRFLFMLEKINMPEVTQIAISVLIKTAPSKQLLFLPCRENTAFRAWVLWHSIIIYSMNQNLMFFLRGAVLFVVLLWRQGIKQRFSSCYLSIPLIWHSSLKEVPQIIQRSRLMKWDIKGFTYTDEFCLLWVKHRLCESRHLVCLVEFWVLSAYDKAHNCEDAWYIFVE